MGHGHLSGYAANRLLTAAQLYHKYHLPIITSGGKVLETTGTEAETSRAILQFQKAGVIVIPWPTDYQANVHSLISWFDFVPSSGALTNIALASKEYLGLAAIKWY